MLKSSSAASAATTHATAAFRAVLSRVKLVAETSKISTSVVCLTLIW